MVKVAKATVTSAKASMRLGKEVRAARSLQTRCLRSQRAGFVVS
jgi:hypothetical protein